MPSLKKAFTRSRSRERTSIKPSGGGPFVLIKNLTSNFESEFSPLKSNCKSYFSKNTTKSAAGTTKSLPADGFNKPDLRVRLPARARSLPRSRKLSPENSLILKNKTSPSFPSTRFPSSSDINDYSVQQKIKRHYSYEGTYNEDDFTCAICLEILRRPRELICGHAFCLLCLQKYSNSCFTKFTCPSCRQIVKLPLNGVSDLKRNCELEKLTEKFSKKQNRKTHSAELCFQCQSENNIVECQHCQKGWCQFCSTSHGERVKKEFLDLKSRLEEAKDVLKFRKLEEEGRLKRLEKKIVQVVEIKISELSDKKDNLVKEVEEMRTKERLHTENQLKEFETTLEKTKSHLTWIEAGEQIPILKQLLKSSNAKVARVTFDCSSITLSSTFEDYSDSPTSESTSAIRVINEHTENAEDDVDEKLMNLPREHGSLYRKKSNVSKHKWGQNVCERPAGLAISPWTNLIYVTGSDACKIYIYDQGGKQIGNFGSRGHDDGQFLCPIGLSFSQTINELYITDKWKHCIHVFDAEGNFLRQLGKKGKGLGQFSSPEGIATDRNGSIFIADTCNDRVQVLDSEGIFLKEIGIVSTELVSPGRRYTKREFSEPVGVAVNKEGTQIYVADSGNHRIRVFNSGSGERILIFGSRGNNKGQFESPECLTVDSKGFIIVGDSGNGRVQIFRPNGQFLRFLGAKNNSEGEFGWVSGVTTSSTNDVLVTDFKNNSLAVF